LCRRVAEVLAWVDVAVVLVLHCVRQLLLVTVAGRGGDGRIRDGRLSRLGWRLAGHVRLFERAPLEILLVAATGHASPSTLHARELGLVTFEPLCFASDAACPQPVVSYGAWRAQTTPSRKRARTHHCGSWSAFAWGRGSRAMLSVVLGLASAVGSSCCRFPAAGARYPGLYARARAPGPWPAPPCASGSRHDSVELVWARGRAGAAEGRMGTRDAVALAVEAESRAREERMRGQRTSAVSCQQSKARRSEAEQTTTAWGGQHAALTTGSGRAR